MQTEKPKTVFAWQQTMAQGIVDVLSQEILLGRIPPGTHLREAELSKKFGTSRGPVREALRLLEAKRLIQYEANRGAHVSMLSAEDVAQIYEVRLLLEKHVVSERSVNELDADRLEEIVGEMRKHAVEKDLPSLVTDDLAFHGYMVRQSDNSYLRRLWEEFDLAMGAIFLVIVGNGVVSLDRIADRHMQLVDAYRSRLQGRIVSALESHYRGPAQNLLDLKLDKEETGLDKEKG